MNDTIEKNTDEKVLDVSDEPIYINYDSVPKQGKGDGNILFMQFTLCIIILFFVFAADIIKSDFLSGLAAAFKEFSNGETDEVYTNTVRAVISHI